MFYVRVKDDILDNKGTGVLVSGDYYVIGNSDVTVYRKDPEDTKAVFSVTRSYYMYILEV